jgi:hypothetical protein
MSSYQTYKVVKSSILPTLHQETSGRRRQHAISRSNLALLPLKPPPRTGRNTASKPSIHNTQNGTRPNSGSLGLDQAIPNPGQIYTIRPAMVRVVNLKRAYRESGAPLPGASAPSGVLEISRHAMTKPGFLGEGRSGVAFLSTCETHYGRLLDCILIPQQLFVYFSPQSVLLGATHVDRGMRTNFSVSGLGKGRRMMP